MELLPFFNFVGLHAFFCVFYCVFFLPCSTINSNVYCVKIFKVIKDSYNALI